MGKLIYLKDVVTLALDKDKCTGCGVCVTVCPREVLRMDNGSAAVRDRDACMECGACAMNCPAGALSVEKGVGCAAAVINSALGRKDAGCCCVLEPAADGKSVEKSRQRKTIGGCC